MTLLPKWMTATRIRLEDAHAQQEQAKEQRERARALKIRAEFVAAESGERARKNHLAQALDQLWTRGHRA